MKLRHRLFLWLALLMPAGVIASAQGVDWRFGFEYIEIEPPFATEAQHDTLLSRLRFVTASQGGEPGINVDGLGGGWAGMQPGSKEPIDFSQSDSWVRRLGRNGFSLVWNLIPNAAWAQLGNGNCIDGPGADECAPDTAHEQEWYDYVRKIVERYDGDGVDDMPGLTVPVRYYVMTQEVYFEGGSRGDAGEAKGEGFWDDNMADLIRLHRLTYRAIHDADPTGRSSLVGSGGWLFDLYSDFPDYPAVDGPLVQARINGDNLGKTSYRKGFDSLIYLLGRLGDDSDGAKCDYIGWHPHMGWKATDQSMKLIRTYASAKPIFIDDMWSNMLTDVVPHNGYAQFLGGDSIEGDFPNSTVASYALLRDRLNAGDPATLDWYNGKGAREAVKCFATVFGEGAERASFSLSNDFNPSHPLYGFSQLWRYTGLVGNKNTNYAPKPVTYTMRLLVDKLNDFTSVTRVDVSPNPLTRCYRFERRRGTPCYVLWSESAPNPADPAVPNGETIALHVDSDTLLKSGIIARAGITVPPTQKLYPTARTLTLQLGFEPVIIEEVPGGSAEVPAETLGDIVGLTAFPNPASGTITVAFRSGGGDATQDLFDIAGRPVSDQVIRHCDAGYQQATIPTSRIAPGAYILQLHTGNHIERLLVHVIP
jgi:hypothetical protein